MTFQHTIRTSRLVRSTVGLAAGAVLALGLTGCTIEFRTNEPPGSTPQPTPSASHGTGKGTGGGQQGGGKGTGGGQQGGGHTTTASPPASGPRIVYFRIKQKPQCPQGTTQFPVDGVPVVLEWKVTGAEQVTLSVDGPGVYNTYPAEGSETLSFPCSGDPGTFQHHSYTLRTVGGHVKSKTLTASAKVYEIAQV